MVKVVNLRNLIFSFLKWGNNNAYLKMLVMNISLLKGMVRWARGLVPISMSLILGLAAFHGVAASASDPSSIYPPATLTHQASSGPFAPPKFL